MSLDAKALAQGLSYPGIDPRTWVGRAIVQEFYIDGDDEGCFAKVKFLPSEVEEQAFVPPIFGGKGWGMYAPLAVNDRVIVGFPNGDADDGLVVIAREWSPARPPPQDIKDYPDDVILVADADAHVRIRTQGEGSIILKVPEDGPKVYLGDDDGTEPIALGTKSQVNFDALHAKLSALYDLLSGSPAGDPLLPWIPVPTDGGLALQTIAKTMLGPGALEDVEAERVEAK